MWRSLFTLDYLGVGRGTGRLLSFAAAGREFAFFGSIRFTLLRGVAFAFAVFAFARFALTDLFVLPFLLPFAFSLVVRGRGRFGLFSFEVFVELVFRFSLGSSGVTFSDDSPSLVARLMSIATV
jgi:hypothetical protein